MSHPPEKGQTCVCVLLIRTSVAIDPFPSHEFQELVIFPPLTRPMKGRRPNASESSGRPSVWIPITPQPIPDASPGRREENRGMDGIASSYQVARLVQVVVGVHLVHLVGRGERDRLRAVDRRVPVGVANRESRREDVAARAIAHGDRERRA